MVALDSHHFKQNLFSRKFSQEFAVKELKLQKKKYLNKWELLSYSTYLPKKQNFHIYYFLWKHGNTIIVDSVLQK